MTIHRLPSEAATQIRTQTPCVMRLVEGAAYLCCSTRKLRGLIASNRVRHARIGNRIVLRKEWLDALLGD